MSYYAYLVETKNEYTINLINILAPFMYQGIKSIYDDAKTNADNDEILALFQKLLRKVPSWNEYLISQETGRIIKQSAKGEIIEDLIKAVIKSNIMILTNTPPEKKDNMRIKHDITTEKFIHYSYIEIAREIFQNPFLFYHCYDDYELKENQRKSIKIIKNSIEQAIRKLLPMNIILQNYLGSTFDPQNDNFEDQIPESDYNNLRQMLNNELPENSYQLTKKNNSQNNPQNNPSNPPNPPNPSPQFRSQSQQANIDVPQISVAFSVHKAKTENDANDDNNAKIKELARPNLSPIETKANNILLQKTSQAIIESQSKSPKSPKLQKMTKSQTRSSSKPKPKRQQNSNDVDDDESVSYFNQIQNNEFAGIYENTRKQTAKPKQAANKTYINYEEMNNNSSAYLNSIMHDVSSLDENVEVQNKSKYFKKTNI